LLDELSQAPLFDLSIKRQNVALTLFLIYLSTDASTNSKKRAVKQQIMNKQATNQTANSV